MTETQWIHALLQLQTLISAKYLEIEKLLQLLHGIIRTLDDVTNRSRVTVDLIVITSDKTLVTEEVDVLVFGAGDVLFGLDVLQAIGLVPTGWENVERDLAANREALSQVRDAQLVD